ncbi:hypothetical protein OG749_37055 [Streptomyces nojiriensis]
MATTAQDVRLIALSLPDSSEKPASWLQAAPKRLIAAHPELTADTG